MTAHLLEGAQLMSHTRALMYVRTYHPSCAICPGIVSKFPHHRFASFHSIVPYVAISWLKQSLPLRVRSGRAASAYVMGKASRQKEKAPYYRPVTGGTHLAFHGGWGAAGVQLPCIALGGRFFVHCEVGRGARFCRLAFGSSKPSKEDVSAVTIIKVLQRAVVAGVEDDDAGEGTPVDTVERDPLADAICARDSACEKKKSKAAYKREKRRKAKLRSGPPEATMVR